MVFIRLIMNEGVTDAETVEPIESGIPSVSRSNTLSSRRTVHGYNNISESENVRKVKRLRKKAKGPDHSPLIKYGSLLLLVAQLVGLVMLMRYSRTHSGGKDLYLSSTAVFCMEVSVYCYLEMHFSLGYGHSYVELHFIL